MAYNEALADRMRDVFTRLKVQPEEKRMFGGLAFMVAGKMSCGIVKEELMIRVVAEKYEAALEQQHSRPMDFTGKPLKEFLYVNPEGLVSEGDLQHWMELGIEHALRASKK